MVTTSAPSSSASVPELEPVPPPDVGVGFWVRAGARIIDTIVLTVCGMFAGFVGGVAHLVATGHAAPASTGFHPLPLIASSVATVVFHAIAETWAGGTPGKLICGLRVIGQDGKRIGFLRGLGRNLAYFIDALFFALPAYSAMDASGPRNLRYGDKWARTMVVSAADANLRVPRSLAMVFVTLMVATAANMSVNALALLASWS